MSENSKNNYYTISPYAYNDEKEENDAKKNEDYKNFISIGKCSRFYLFILGAGSFKLLSLLILGANNIYEDGIGLFGFCPVLSNYNFVQSIYMYIGYIIFGFIFYHFKGVETIDINGGILEKKDQLMRNLTIQNIHKNKVAKNLANDNTKCEIAFLCLAFAVHIETKKVLYIEGFQFFNFWIIEIIFMQVLMRIYFTIDVYIHNKIAIIFNVVVCSAILITASFLPTSLSIDNPDNSYQTTEEKLGNYFYCILIILFFMVLSFIFCFTRIYSKVLMEFKFVSPYKLVALFGIAGVIVSIFSSLITYYINYKDNIISYFSDMRSSLDQGKKYKFYGEIFLVSPIYAFVTCVEFIFEILTIYYLNPFYILMSNTLYYGITELIFFILNSSNDTLVIIHFVLTELTEIFACFGFFIYLEIIELNFCGLSNNLRLSISQKGADEFKILSSTNIEREDEGDNDKNVGNNENKERKQFGNIKRYTNI